MTSQVSCFLELGSPPRLKRGFYSNWKLEKGSESLKRFGGNATHPGLEQGFRSSSPERSKRNSKELLPRERNSEVVWKRSEGTPTGSWGEAPARLEWESTGDFQGSPRGRGRAANFTHRADLQRQGALQRLHLRHPRRVGRRGGTPASGPTTAGRRGAGQGTGRR